MMHDGDVGSVSRKARKQSAEGAVGSSKLRMKAAMNYWLMTTTAGVLKDNTRLHILVGGL